MKPSHFILIAVFALSIPLVCGQWACDYHLVNTVIAPPPPTATPTPVPVFINLVGSAFSPDPVTCMVGNNIVFTNLDAYPHTVHPDDGTGTCLTNQFVNPGMAVTYTFTMPGTVNYHCWFHSSYFGPPCDGTATGMVGTLVVQ